MGSPEFAVPPLEALHSKFNVVGVVTQPDKPSGRGRKLTPPPVKTFAETHSVPYIQPQKLSSEAAYKQIEAWKPDLIVVTAYGKILRNNILSLPKYGCINVHASLLPRWRGAAPIQAAILHGDEKTGCTIMLMDEGLDTGPILTQIEEPIRPKDTTSTLAARLSTLGANLLVDTIPGFIEGKIKPKQQDNALATYAPMIKKSQGKIDTNQTAETIERQVRAYNPWPGTYIHLPNGKILKIIEAHVASTSPTEAKQFSQINGFPAIATANGYLVLDIVQPAGKKAMRGDAYLRGSREWGKE